MNSLSKVYVFKIAVTLLFWSLPLILLPVDILTAAGIPPHPTYMFLRLLGWAYLALCTGYVVGLQASLKGEKVLGPVYVGLVSNGGAFAVLLYYGLSGAWLTWGSCMQLGAWASVLATLCITVGLYLYGLKD